MNVTAMRRIDRLAGVPCCALLTLARRVRGAAARRTPAAQPRRIAVIKLAEQGATVLAHQALARAREMVGPENLFFVVFAQNRFILDLLGIVPPGNVLEIRTTSPLRAALDVLRVVRRMRRERIDATVDLEFFARSSAILSYLSGARVRVGFHAFHGEASYRGDLMTHRLSFNPFLHASQVFLTEVEALRISPEALPACDVMPQPSTSPPQHRPREQQVREVEALLGEALGREVLPPLVLLNANCGDLLPLRRWPPERYVELARRLLDRYPELAVVFTGSPAEAREARELVRQVGSDRCVSLAGRTTLEQLVVLYGLSELLVTNDSGPAHYATLTPIDVITLFGPETPACFGARTPRSHLLWAGIACSPCVNAFNDRQSACTDNVCMQRITADDVFELAGRVYEGRRSRTPQPAASLRPRPRPASASSSSGR
jgi:ADP-heptose:LPS heptosyltransferase